MHSRNDQTTFSPVSETHSIPRTSWRTVAFGAAAAGVAGLGAVAIGVIAIRRLAVGRIVIQNATLGSAEIRNLTVTHLHANERQ